MRDEAFIDHDVDHAGRGGRTFAAFGAVASVALLAMLVAWSYSLGVRDAGDVPVIRAMEGAMRERPAEPGGARFAHQGRQIYDLVSGAPEVAREVSLAPPPEPLAEEDAPLAALDPTGARELPTMPDPALALPTAIAEDTADAAGSSLDDLVAAVMGRDATTGSAIGSSPLAPPRPSRAAASGGETRVAAAAPVGAPVQSDAAPLAPGRPAIQLGAYLSEEMANTMWREIVTRNGDLLAGRQPVVTTLVGSSRTLHALRAAPFADEAEARRLCDALRARSEDCLVTELR